MSKNAIPCDVPGCELVIVKENECECILKLKCLDLDSPVTTSSTTLVLNTSSSFSSSRSPPKSSGKTKNSSTGSLQKPRRSLKDTVWIENGEDCFGGKGKIYLVPNSDSYMVLCHDLENSKTYYTEHKVGTNESPDKMVKNLKTWQGDPNGFYRETYKHSGYDKGHLIARADYKTNLERNYTMDYKNSAPQAQDFNRNGWYSLEQAIRKLQKYGSIIITGTTGEIEKIKNCLSVSKYFYKMFTTKTNQTVFVVGLNSDKSSNEKELSKLGESNCDEVFDKKQLSKLLPYVTCLLKEDFLEIFHDEDDKSSIESLIEQFNSEN